MKYLLFLTYMTGLLYFNQILHNLPPPFSIFFYDPTHHRMLFCRKPHYFLMHGYLLMYCIYRTLHISLDWWIHLHPLENKNSLKIQSHISLAMLPKQYADGEMFVCVCGGSGKRERGTIGSVLFCWRDMLTALHIYFLIVELNMLWQSSDPSTYSTVLHG